MMPDQIPSDVAAAIASTEKLTREACAKATDPKLFELPGERGHYVYYRDSDGNLVEGEDLPIEPRRARGTINTQTVAGFAAAVADSRGDAGKSPRVQFLSEARPAVLAMVNPGREGAPDFNDLQVRFQPKLDAAWERWCKFADADNEHSQREAIEFIEDAVADFAAIPTDYAEGQQRYTSFAALKAWLETLTLKVVSEVESREADAERSVGDQAKATGSAMLRHVTLHLLPVHERGDKVLVRCRWRAGRGENGKLAVSAGLVNADEAERRVWLGPAPAGATWRPLVDQIADALGVPVIV